MPENRKRLWLVAILLIYVAIAVAGLVIAYMVKTYFLPHTASTPQPYISQVKQSSTPKGWKKYVNTENKISFAYPPDDKIKTSSLGFGVTNITLTNPKEVVDFQFFIAPKSIAQAIGQDFDNYYSMENNSTKTIKNPLSKDTTTEKFTKIRNRSISGLEALEYQSTASNAPKDAKPAIGTFISTGDTLIVISTNSENKTRLEDLLNSFSYQP